VIELLLLKEKKSRLGDCSMAPPRDRRRFAFEVDGRWPVAFLALWGFAGLGFDPKSASCSVIN